MIKTQVLIARIDRLLDIAKRRQYLGEFEEPPHGEPTHQGPRGGRYYEVADEPGHEFKIEAQDPRNKEILEALPNSHKKIDVSIFQIDKSEDLPDFIVDKLYDDIALYTGVMDFLGHRSLMGTSFVKKQFILLKGEKTLPQASPKLWFGKYYGKFRELLVTHEYAHQYDWQIMDEQTRKYVNRAFKGAKQKGNTITKYALTDEMEYFAEGYAYYRYFPEDLKKEDLNLFRIMDEYVFKGAE